MPDGFNEAMIALLPNLRRFALSLSRRSDMADDLVQITVERALKAKHNFDPAQPLDMWLFRILRNAFIDMTRRAKTRGTEIAIADTPEAAVIDGARDAENRLMLHQTEAAMARLPTDQREVMILVCMQDLSYKEAAEVLEIPVGTVMSRLSRARLALAKDLGIN